MSNQNGLNGASAILYDNVLENFSEEMNYDLIILPSSVHEVLLLTIDNDIDFREFQELVKYVNQAETAIEDRLSDNVYLYDRSIKKLRIAI